MVRRAVPWRPERSVIAARAGGPVNRAMIPENFRVLVGELRHSGGSWLDNAQNLPQCRDRPSRIRESSAVSAVSLRHTEIVRAEHGDLP